MSDLVLDALSAMRQDLDALRKRIEKLEEDHPLDMEHQHCVDRPEYANFWQEVKGKLKELETQAQEALNRTDRIAKEIINHYHKGDGARCLIATKQGPAQPSVGFWKHEPLNVETDSKQPDDPFARGKWVLHTSGIVFQIERINSVGMIEGKDMATYPAVWPGNCTPIDPFACELQVGDEWVWNGSIPEPRTVLAIDGEMMWYRFMCLTACYGELNLRLKRDCIRLTRRPPKESK